MIIDNSETRSALACKIRDLIPDFCNGCRDKVFCDHHRQMAIDEWIKMKGEEHGSGKM